MGRRGRKRRLDIESEYWLLLVSGVGTVEACKRLGVGRKTGYRWRAENGGLSPGPWAWRDVWLLASLRFVWPWIVIRAASCWRLFVRRHVHRLPR